VWKTAMKSTFFLKGTKNNSYLQHLKVLKEISTGDLTKTSLDWLFSLVIDAKEVTTASRDRFPVVFSDSGLQNGFNELLFTSLPGDTCTFEAVDLGIHPSR
jgi:hypothetical protein